MIDILARYHEPRTVAPRLVVVHVNAVDEPVTGGAQNVARYCQRPASERDGSKGGYHAISDNIETVRGGLDEWVVNGAAGANRDGLHVCLVGSADQSSAQWADRFSSASIDNAARYVAGWCVRYKIPASRLAAVDIRNDQRGVCGHRDVSLAYGQSDHYDPGPHFPWDLFLRRVRSFLPVEDDLPYTKAELKDIFKDALREEISAGLDDEGQGTPKSWWAAWFQRAKQDHFRIKKLAE